MEAERKKIAWFSSAQPRTKSFHFTSHVQSQMVGAYDIDYILSDDDKEKFFAGLTRYQYFIYQVEDDQSAAFIDPFIHSYPGIVIVHDLRFVERQNNYAYLHPLTYAARVKWEGELRNLGLNEDLGRGFIKEQLNHSLLRIFTNERSYRDYQRLAARVLNKEKQGDTKAFYLPLPVKAEPLSRNNDKLTLGLCGGAAAEYRAHKIFAALRDLPDWRALWLVPLNEEREARALLKEYEVEGVELVFGQNNTWPDLLGGVDVALHLQYSALRQQEIHILQSMASGCPVLVSNFGYGEYLPDKVVTKVDCGYSETEQLVAALKNFTDDNYRRAAAQVALEYVRTNHDPAATAEELLIVLNDYCEFFSRIHEQLKSFLMLRPTQLYRSASPI
ncbi:MAG: glycosyltransferase [Deltaproteobacteria bacterium]|nr:glycosyltransferase [Deltaproteobacteria bacterium]